MLDFFGDGLKIKRTGLPRIGLCLIVFLPPIFFALSNPRMFLVALEFAGGFGEAILNGLLPVLMVWIGRYHMNLKSEYSLIGGRFSLILILLAAFSVVLLEAFS